MRKTAIATALVLIFLANNEANAMTLVSLRPNLMRTAATAQTEQTVRPSAFGWLITLAATTIENVKERLAHMAPADQSAKRQSYNI